MLLFQSLNLIRFFSLADVDGAVIDISHTIKAALAVAAAPIGEVAVGEQNQLLTRNLSLAVMIGDLLNGGQVIHPLLPSLLRHKLQQMTTGREMNYSNSLPILKKLYIRR